MPVHRVSASSPPCVHNVLLVGQFNYAQKVAQVAHWCRRWHEVFANVVVYGPFDANATQALEARGVPVVISEADMGYVSPYSNLLDAYQKHAGGGTPWRRVALYIPL